MLDKLSKITTNLNKLDAIIIQNQFLPVNMWVKMKM